MNKCIRVQISSYTYKVCSESIETESVFTKREINNRRYVNFLQNMSCVKEKKSTDVILP